MLETIEKKKATCRKILIEKNVDYSLIKFYNYEVVY